MKALWSWQRNSEFNRASRAGKERHYEHFPADTPLSLREDGDVPTIHALMAQDRYVAQLAYITLKQLVHITPERIAQLYEVFNDDMPGNISELHEMDHWKAIMRNGECRRETRHTRRFKKSTPTYTPACTLLSHY